MIPHDKKINELTWGEVMFELDERYKESRNPAIPFQPNPVMQEFINIKVCAELTGYTVGYIRQLVFKREIPFYKGRKPLRFKRSEIQEWMVGRKYTPIEQLAEQHMENNPGFGKQNKKTE